MGVPIGVPKCFRNSLFFAGSANIAFRWSTAGGRDRIVYDIIIEYAGHYVSDVIY